MTTQNQIMTPIIVVNNDICSFQHLKDRIDELVSAVHPNALRTINKETAKETAKPSTSKAKPSIVTPNDNKTVPAYRLKQTKEFTRQVSLLKQRRQKMKRNADSLSGMLSIK